MPGVLQPLSQQSPVVNEDGTPTEYFIRWAQQRQIDISEGITEAEAQALIDTWAASRSVIAGTGLSGGGPLSADVTLNLDASIDLLTDVDTSTTPPTDGQALVWNDTDSLWVPGTVSGGGGSDSGVDYFIAEKQVILPIDNRNATTNIGCAQTAAGTAARARSTTNAFTKRRRLGVGTGSTNANGNIRFNTSTQPFGLGEGWQFRCRFGISTTVANSRLAVGFPGTWNGTSNPSSAAGIIFVVGKDNTDTNLQIIRNDAAGAAVKTDLGASFPANTSSTDIYEITLASAVGASTMTYEVTNLTSGATTSGSFSTDVPAAGSLGLCGLWVATGATGGHQGDFFGMDYQLAYNTTY